MDAINQLPKGDVKKLQGENGYRLRVGDYRVIFDRKGYITDCSFEDCRLWGADFTGCSFEHVSFQGAELTGAVFPAESVSFLNLDPEQLQTILLKREEQ